MLVPDIASAYKSRMKVADLSSKEEIAIFENAKKNLAGGHRPAEQPGCSIEVKMAPPSLDDTMPDVERLSRALRKFMNLKRVRICIPFSENFRMYSETVILLWNVLSVQLRTICLCMIFLKIKKMW